MTGNEWEAAFKAARPNPIPATWGQLEAAGAALGQQEATICDILAQVAAQLPPDHPDFNLRSRDIIRTDLNGYAQTVGCPLPYPDDKVTVHITSAVFQSVAGTGGTVGRSGSSLSVRVDPEDDTVIPPPRPPGRFPDLPDCEVRGWATRTRPAPEVWAEAQQDREIADAIAQGQITGIAQIANPAAHGGAIWAYRKGTNEYRVHLTGSGIFRPSGTCPDPEIGAAAIVAGSQYPQGMVKPPIVQPPVNPNDPDQPGHNPDVTQFLSLAREPIVRQCRRCPRGYIMADESFANMCFPKKILPPRFRQNKARKAVISYSDGQSISKATAALKRLETWGEDKVKRIAAELHLTRRSSRRRETHTERHEREHHRK